jgi:hypothetical protein
VVPDRGDFLRLPFSIAERQKLNPRLQSGLFADQQQLLAMRRVISEARGLQLLAAPYVERRHLVDHFGSELPMLLSSSTKLVEDRVSIIVGSGARPESLLRELYDDTPVLVEVDERSTKLNA